VRIDRIARDLCVLTDWYTERPAGLTFKELGERYGMSESGAFQLVNNTRGRGTVAHLLWPAWSQQLIHEHDQHAYTDLFVSMVERMLKTGLPASASFMAMADDRLELAKVRGS
jgi:hypothetical protein